MRQGAVTANGYIAARGFKTANLCCCPCTQVVTGDLPSGTTTPVVGDRVTQNGGASGIIISITAASSITATIRLDDCNKPFTNSSALDVNGAVALVGLVVSQVISCEPKDYPGRRRDYPRDPQNNPKNYNKKQY